MMPRASRFAAAAATTLITLTLATAGCGAPTVESQVARFDRVADKLDALGTKKPQLKADIQKKLVEFRAEAEKAKAQGGEDGARALARVCSRVEAYERSLNPTQAAKKPGDKIGVTPGAKVGVQPAGATGTAVAPGGKVGVQPAAPASTGAGASGFGGAKTAPTAPATKGAGASGFGGTKAAPAPGTKVAPAAGVNTAPAAGGGDSGFGGPAKTAPAPAPAPVKKTGGSGF